MSTRAPARLTDRRAYELDGIPLEVAGADPAPGRALDRRLCAHRAPRTQEGALRLEFALSDAASPALPAAGRPVYETPDGRIVYHPADDTLSGAMAGVSLRGEPGRGLVRLAAAAYTGRRLYVAAHPLATIGLIELLKRRGRFNVHAACLADDGRGVLLAGPSGAGKSTLALALLGAGLALLGDDMNFLTGDRPVRVVGFRDAVGVTAPTAERFAPLRGLRDQPPADGFPKHLVRAEDIFAGASTRDCEPVALVFPELSGGGPSRLERLDPGEALLRLVPDVLLTQAAATRAHLAALAALLEQVSCHRLEFGPDVERAAELVAALLPAAPRAVRSASGSAGGCHRRAAGAG